MLRHWCECALVANAACIRLTNDTLTRHYGKQTGISRQIRVMNKLFGQRVKGRKKVWFPADTESAATPMSSSLKSGHATPGNGLGFLRRTVVLNKMFMTHISDLLASGEVSEAVLGKGLQILSVKCSKDFANINIYWLCSETNTSIEDDLQEELKRCSGLLRHRLSQLGLMGQVPRINFVRDRTLTMLKELNISHQKLEELDQQRRDDEEKTPWHLQHEASSLVKTHFYGQLKDFLPANNTVENNQEIATVWRPPVMRHDILGMHHSQIMSCIQAKIKKHRQVWDAHHDSTVSSSRVYEKAASPSSKAFANSSQPHKQIAQSIDNRSN